MLPNQRNSQGGGTGTTDDDEGGVSGPAPQRPGHSLPLQCRLGVSLPKSFCPPTLAPCNPSQLVSLPVGQWGSWAPPCYTVSTLWPEDLFPVLLLMEGSGPCGRRVRVTITGCSAPPAKPARPTELSLASRNRTGHPNGPHSKLSQEHTQIPGDPAVHGCFSREQLDGARSRSRRGRPATAAIQPPVPSSLSLHTSREGNRILKGGATHRGHCCTPRGALRGQKDNGQEQLIVNGYPGWCGSTHPT